MEPIQESLKKWMRNNESFQNRMNQARKQVLEAPEVKRLIEEKEGLTRTIAEKNLIKLHEYQNQSLACEKCPSREKCINILPGYVPRAEVDGEEIKIAYDKCPRQIKKEKEEKQRSLVKSLYMPKELHEASVERLDFSGSEERNEAIMKTVAYIDKLGEELPQKGLYFHGLFGVGKTYFLGVIANELSNHNVETMVIYMPELVREMKASIKDDSLTSKVDAFKKVPVLMLDDIGAESQSAWFRDEILGSILQHRMMEGLPVFFTSNYSLKELEQVMGYTNKGEVGALKATRIIERIRQLSETVEVSGPNRRNQ
ncbi:primosomal protein DnaI [Salimicrobium flavidum]|uniref:Replicative DNA helicase loader DnaI n=1 Tax=Salimicrobium flavidum TaxID=570947 RepID=A0A1N7JQE0_9BACI|nr:primosomal protein DnaI [Salimicrobium flavidum]SIS51454.1 replicative DNA helicase loader DnaI [Salimicrobium flavidum]